MEHEPLNTALRRAGAEIDHEAPPPAVWAKVRAAHRDVHAPRRRWAAWSGAAACAALLLGSALLMLAPPPADAPGAGASDFVPLVPPERWSATEGAPAWLVSSELQREQLAALGLPYDPARAGERVRAELLMHPSGEVLAVRFLR